MQKLTDFYGFPKVRGWAISPTSTGTSANSNTGSDVVVAGLLATITTGGSPVVITVVPDGSTNIAAAGIVSSAAATSAAGFKLFRSGILVGYFELLSNAGGATSSNILVPPGAFTFFDTPPAGTYTYTMTGNLISGGGSWEFNYCKLFAKEL